MTEKMSEIRKSLTLAEVGVIISIILSVGGIIFTGGVVYGQVRANSVRLDKIEPQVNSINARLERIDTNVEWLRNQREK